MKGVFARTKNLRALQTYEYSEVPVNRLTIAARIFAGVSAGVFSASAAYSQDSSAGLLEEIVVTAQKRAESLQDVPISITALSGEELTKRQIRGP
ncbi:MAG: hypothetical protein RBS02_12390, partial [Steroidobacteraceae bacterium]|nr:hypothetical protein [Steroidobacteraceae bacterium]